MKRVLLLSGYDARSHHYWQQLLEQQLKEFRWTVLSLPARHFAWRMGGNAFNFAQNKEQLNQKYDVILATSVVDLTALLAWFPHLHGAKKILYFHENQMVYPASQSDADQLHFQLSSIKSAVAADQLLFNSIYNQNTFIGGVAQLAQRMPDGFEYIVASELLEKSHVLPAPLADECFHQSNKPFNRVWQVVWNHRWEYDKGPKVLAEVILKCQQQQLPFRFAVIGQQFRNIPRSFEQIKGTCKSMISYWGFIESYQRYQKILQQSDIVLSTAYHEFQGLAVAEAVAAGCTPLVPDRLVYPEWYQLSCRYDSCPDDTVKEAKGVVARLKKWLQSGLPDADVSAMRWSNLKNQYRHFLNS